MTQTSRRAICPLQHSSKFPFQRWFFDCESWHNFGNLNFNARKVCGWHPSEICIMQCLSQFSLSTHSYHSMTMLVRPHTAAVVHLCLDEVKIHLLPLPSKSPDLNLVEHVYNIFGGNVRARIHAPLNLGFWLEWKSGTTSHKTLSQRLFHQCWNSLR